ncbi:aminotransferase DegT [Bacillus sp. FJAT-27225]|uniref:LegC family aminotransferase n=1 Tax=Bacillus sp. FJAT-27225 TaxID=1743144 RepID=UPI00080C32E0|nr:LegC family aminotransferase [Bacillus sp. FJAT-27225]OCA87871.1 aminotransferase DegT [Bacillus sp. FJAT-27225]
MMNQFNTPLLVEKLRNVLPKERDFIALHEPVFRGNEWEYVKECIDTSWVSSVGKYVDLFEEKLAEYTGVKKAVAVVNGTAALHVSLKLVGVEQGDEVLIPALTFIATANAVVYTGAVPHFVDSEHKTLGLDPRKLRDYLSEISEMKNGFCVNKKTGRRIKAVVPMHTFGHPVNLDLLTELCAEYNIELVEDAAESLGSYYKGIHTGNVGKISALSFNGNKVITTGGGGAILTNDEELGKLAKHITTTAKVPHKWEFNHDMVAFNYRMPNINAALGCAQLEKLPDYLDKKRALTNVYIEELEGFNGISVFKEPEFAKSNYWLNALVLDDGFEQYRDEILTETNNNGIMTRPAWTLMHQLPMFKDNPKMELHVAESLQNKLINIPSSVFLGDHYE